MTRRIAWLGLLFIAAQTAAGCCWHRPFACWRMNHCGPSCAPSCAVPMSCPSCFYGPQSSAPVLTGPPVSYAPGAVVMPGSGPIVEPSRDIQPLPMPKPGS
jgi:hypothetical protein